MSQRRTLNVALCEQNLFQDYGMKLNVAKVVSMECILEQSSS